MISGTLEIVPLEEVFQWLAQARRTGILALTNGSGKAWIQFESGAISAARSDRPADRLGEMLLARSLITQAQLDAALAAQARHGLPLGGALVRHGALDAQTLELLLIRQAEECVLGVFEWESGSFGFEDGAKLAGDPTLSSPLDPTGVVLEAMRRRDELPRLAAAIGSSEAIPVLVDRAASHRIAGTMGSDAELVLATIDDARTIDELVELLAMERFIVFEVLATAVKEGAVKMVRRPRRPLPRSPAQLASHLLDLAKTELGSGRLVMAYRLVAGAAALGSPSAAIEAEVRALSTALAEQLDRVGLSVHARLSVEPAARGVMVGTLGSWLLARVAEGRGISLGSLLGTAPVAPLALRIEALALVEHGALSLGLPSPTAPAAPELLSSIAEAT